jgi:hypothetical protein
MVTLKGDHTVVFADFPKFDGLGDKLVCRLSGSANWELHREPSSGFGWSVEFLNYRPTPELAGSPCASKDSTWSILVLNQHAPYRLYLIVGDPDSDTGVEFKKTFH